ncbi:DNA cytosine methyltransferase [Vibrio mediterranei]|uniref:DNA cytosine methyltransferase n=1 Tax=Vibrio mediterranei TaxID=689 RepID=UPI004068F15F
MQFVQTFVPSGVTTKQLAVTRYADGRRKVQISSNWLPLYMFEKGTRVIEKAIGLGQGYTVEVADLCLFKCKQIYQRSYNKRRNNPFEVVSETSSKKVLDVALPPETTHVHVEFSEAKLTIRPMKNVFAERIARFLKTKKPFSVFSACSSGVDCSALEESEFKVDHLLEWRPPEARDKTTDKSETGAFVALENLRLKNLFNENIETFDSDYVARKVTQGVDLLSISLQCDDSSSLKNHAQRDLDLENGRSTVDMAYDGLRLVQAVNPVAILLEQVAPFAKSDIYRMWKSKLIKWGYTVHDVVVDDRDYGGATPRPRLYSFATSLKETPFQFPSKTPRNKEDLWKALVEPRLSELRDVTKNKALQDGARIGRLRTFKPGDSYSPSVVKSQSRGAKDSLVCVDDQGRFLWPSLGLLRALMGIPDTFSSKGCSQEIETEIIGQAVTWPLYASIAQCIARHFNAFLSNKDPAAMFAA